MSCFGPDGTRWSTSLQTCVGGSPNQSCDAINQDTCVYAMLMGGSYFGGRFVDGKLVLGCVGRLPDALEGDQVLRIKHQGQWFSRSLDNEQHLTRYTSNNPAQTLTLELLRPSTGTRLKIIFRG